MPRRTVSGFVYVGVLLAWVTAGTALAQPIDKRSDFTFKGAVEVPGAMLPAGTYVFRLMDTPSRDIVQVVSDDGRRSYAMFFAHRGPQRLDAPSKPEIWFMETARGMPAAIHTWWYPGERTGYEVVYPRAQLRRRAIGAGPLVLTTVAEDARRD